MSVTTDTAAVRAGLHGLLLRAAGRFADDLVAECRAWLAAGDPVAVGQTITHAALTGAIPLAPADADLVTAVLADAGEDVSHLAGLERSTAEKAPDYAFAPVSPDVLAEYADELPYALDLTEIYDGPGGIDAVDSTAAAVSARNGVEALWRSWRFPAGNTPWPRPRRLYAARVESGADPVTVAEAIRQALPDDVLVEVFGDDVPPPAYQRTAVSFGALVWTATPAHEVQVAALFDELDDDGVAYFSADHPRLAGGERDRVLAYLRQGVPLIHTTEYALDAVEPQRGDAVPVAFHTDGEWIWAEATTYYLAEYGIAPDPDLLDHIAARGGRMPAVPDESVHRALYQLYRRAAASAEYAA
ncbi:hypothetical protein [Paractinoplanes atraurantiacus]|uniref:Uncharacterized protein n=1 Tax=Paractinoplanes atraurantiacus TaxID=1036182 RepID=A0A285KEZ3_9ACTN|nr:hypothetical protein [Actinoplanes atraurantiacus]SNY69851.1 hypothetical protein SAMN05421748_13626 [Actinoplanes atraurantiacus]